MPKLLVLDIDGTLLNSEDIVTPKVKDAIKRVREIGVEVALATGRRVRSTHQVVDEIGIESPLITYNGALVWDTHTESAVRSLDFSESMLKLVIERSVAAGLAPVLLQGPEYGERIVMASPPPESAPYIDWFVMPRISEINYASQEELHRTPNVLTVDVFGPEDQLRRLTSELSALEVQVYHAGPLEWEADPPHWAANLHMPGVTKASGVQVLADALGCTLEDVVAVGDGDNDLPLLEAAGTGVAMGNAADDVKARADAVVLGHDEDGVAEAIQRFILEPSRSETS